MFILEYKKELRKTKIQSKNKREKMNDLRRIEVENRRNLNVEMELDLINKWKRVTKNQNIMRRKLVKALRDSIRKDYDEFINKISNDENLVEYLTSTEIEDGDFLYDKRRKELKYGLRDSQEWKDINNQNFLTYKHWQEDYDQWLSKKTN